MTSPDTVARTMEAIGGVADVVISDMSPNISGAYDADQARSVHLAEQALQFAARVLRPGGDFVVKVFEGDLFPGFLKKVEQHFEWAKASHPAASRTRSSEIYVVGKRFRPSPAAPPRAPALTPQDLAGRHEIDL
jgi:23S rRNA (uridine2552-2'-O)-methyltransferase